MQIFHLKKIFFFEMFLFINKHVKLQLKDSTLLKKNIGLVPPIFNLLKLVPQCQCCSGLRTASSIFFLHFPRGLICCLNPVQGGRTKDKKKKRVNTNFQFNSSVWNCSVEWAIGTSSLLAANKMNVPGKRQLFPCYMERY